MEYTSIVEECVNHFIAYGMNRSLSSVRGFLEVISLQLQYCCSLSSDY